MLMFDVRTCCLVLNVCLKGWHSVYRGSILKYWFIQSAAESPSGKNVALIVHRELSTPKKQDTLPVDAKSVEWCPLSFDGTTMSIKWHSLTQEAK